MKTGKILVHIKTFLVLGRLVFRWNPYLSKKRLGCRWSGFQMGSQIAAILSKLFEIQTKMSEFWMVGNIGLAKAVARPFENWTIWNPTPKKSGFCMFLDFEWSDFRSPLYLKYWSTVQTSVIQVTENFAQAYLNKLFPCLNVNTENYCKIWSKCKPHKSGLDWLHVNQLSQSWNFNKCCLSLEPDHTNIFSAVLCTYGQYNYKKSFFWALFCATTI